MTEVPRFSQVMQANSTRYMYITLKYTIIAHKCTLKSKKKLQELQQATYCVSYDINPFTHAALPLPCQL